MIDFRQGNLLESEADAVVNTVNTVGVMGKGIALMFKERFPRNFSAYEAACKAGEVKLGRMFVTETGELGRPRWVINFPTKKHWRHPSKLEWIEEGLKDLGRVIREKHIESVALPPLGCGNGGLEWTEVRPLLAKAAEQFPGVLWIAYEPTPKYQNVAKRQGVEKLTVARALVAEVIRRYWVLGIECTMLEIQKLAWFLERSIQELELTNLLDLRFEANRYGPFSPRLYHLLNALDGSYLRSDKRIPDCGPMDTIAFDNAKTDHVAAFLRTGDGLAYAPVLERTEAVIDGFQSPLGMELLGTVDWLIERENCEPTLQSLRKGLEKWPGGGDAGQRKLRIFDDRMLQLAIDRLVGQKT